MCHSTPLGSLTYNTRSPPGLQRRRGGHHPRVLRCQPGALDLLPPSVCILDHEMHHEMAGVSLRTELLQQEPESPELELADLIFAPVHGEPEVAVELPRQRGILGRSAPQGREYLQPTPR